LAYFFPVLLNLNLATKGFLTTHKVDLQVNIYTLTNYYWINKALCKKLWPKKFWLTLRPSANVNICWINGFIKIKSYHINFFFFFHVYSLSEDYRQVLPLYAQQAKEIVWSHLLFSCYQAQEQLCNWFQFISNRNSFNNVIRSILGKCTNWVRIVVLILQLQKLKIYVTKSLYLHIFNQYVKCSWLPLKTSKY